MDSTADVVPPWQVSQWFNSAQALSLAGLRGRVVVLHAFQMLCPACISHGLPQALRIHQAFSHEQLAVIGLHTVFEHHEVMGPQALQVFLHEYRVPFPVGIDRAGVRGPVPLTMQAYGLRGTPSLVVFDRHGRVRLNQLGAVDDLRLGALIGDLLAQSPAQAMTHATAGAGHAPGPGACTDGECSVELRA
jgi:AhpC/TSA family